MINFFRKIRQQLLNENKTGKYLKYAIGEIVLVMVGILLALQVNNWNEDRKERVKEKEIVNIIYKELNLNYDFIATITKDFESRLLTAIDLLNMTGSNAKSISMDSLAVLTTRTFAFGSYTPYNMNLSRIMNSEEFNLIQFDSLQTMLGEYEILLDKSRIIMENIMPQYNNWELLEYNVINFDWVKRVLENYNLNSLYKIKQIDFNLNGKDILFEPKFASIVGYQITQIHFLLNRFKETGEVIELMKTYIEEHYSF